MHHYSGLSWLGVSKDTATATLKKRKFVRQVNEDYLAKIKAENPIDIDICQTLSTEKDEMWSFYHDKSHQIWLWWAVDHATNTPLAFTFGTREHKNLDELLELFRAYPKITYVQGIFSSKQ